MVSAAMFEVEARDSGVPVSVLISIAVHVVGMMLFFRMGSIGPVRDEVIINDVELMLQQEAETPERKPAPRAVRRKELAKDFLKLALPSLPKPRTPLEVEAPRIEKRLMEIPDQKLTDRGRMKSPAKLDSLDLSKERMKLAKIQAPILDRERRVPDALPKLDEVGARRAPPKVIALDALRERSGAPAALSAKGAMNIDLGAARRKFETAGLNEAAPTAPARKKSLSDILTSDRPAIDMGPRTVPVTRKAPAFEEIAAPLPKRAAVKAAAEPGEKKKAVEIEGEIENRRVLSSSLPRFPQWAAAQGLIEAEVRIKFYVGASGAVLDDDMKVERSSGYGRLDRLAMEHLKKWRFEPLPFGAKNEYGIITFRFLLE